MLTMLRMAAIALFAAALATIFGPASADATATVSGSLSFRVGSVSCYPSVLCSAQLDPTNAVVEATALANPGMTVDDTESETFSLNLDNSADTTNQEFVDIEEFYLFYITVTNGLFETGEYDFNTRDSLGNFGPPGRCSYPYAASGTVESYGGPPRPGSGGYCFLGDYTNTVFVVAPGTDETDVITARVHVHASSVPEPPAIGIFSSELLIFGYVYCRNLRERRDSPRTPCT
ncbi:MAG: hypothetical protein WB678_14940 [Stellaceae bacterium]